MLNKILIEPEIIDSKINHPTAENIFCKVLTLKAFTGEVRGKKGFYDVTFS
jgi:hypothetical protein